MSHYLAKSVLAVGATAAALMTSTLAQANPTLELVSVQPRMVTTLQQTCESVPVPRPAQVNHAGMILGTIAGAALGNQIGGGSGKTIATAAGAMLGGHYGRGEIIPAGLDYQNVCKNHPVTHQKGEIVTFKYNGKLFSQIVE